MVRGVLKGQGLMGSTNRLLSMKQAAEYIGRHPGTFQNTYRKLGIPHFKVGRSVIFRERDLDAWLVEHRRVG